jgi:catechol 2,3-dioxygenase-like lactoylglutathione lyase family enzyme
VITGIDHLVVICPEILAGVSTLQKLLGSAPVWQSDDPAGASSARFQSGNTGLELLSPAGSGPLCERLKQLLAASGPGLQTLVLGSSDLESDHRLFKRRGLAPEDIVAGESVDKTSQRRRQWRRFRIDTAITGGLRIFVLQHADSDSVPRSTTDASALHDVDHLVITTRHADRALALYGARLGLELLLDRNNRAQNSRLIVFRTGDSGIEVASRSTDVGEAPDRMWGITWKTRDIDAAQARLAADSLDVSNVRDGMRSGTRVFTVRDGTLGIPTLVVAGDNRPA